MGKTGASMPIYPEETSHQRLPEEPCMPIPPELATACAEVRSAGEADTIGGRQARYVAAPASTEEASALLRAAAALGLTVVPRGAGRLQHWGNRPDRCDLIVDTRRLDRIGEHRTADFTVTAQAGVRLRDLEQTVEAGHQSLALYPPRPAFAGTVGGLIATNASGSHRYGFGSPRDRLVGITAVRADGTIVASADAAGSDGRDLIGLLAGSYGSLGLITEATFRLEPLPKISGGIGVNCDDPEHAERLIGELSGPSIAPLGIGVRWVSADEPVRLLVMIQGDREEFQARSDRVRAVGGRPPLPRIDQENRRRLDDLGLPPAEVERLRAQQERIRAEIEDPPADTGTLVRVSYPPARLAETLTRIRAAAADSGVEATIDGSAVTGVLGVKVPGEAPAAAVAGFVTALRAQLAGLSQAATAAPAARAFVLYAPDEVRDVTDAHGPVPSLALLQAVKDEFDPEHRMAPGRLADAV
jgi:glycolate oxidase FAD binding subunit